MQIISESVASFPTTLALALWPVVTLTSLIFLNLAKHVSIQVFAFAISSAWSGLFSTFVLQFTSQRNVPEPFV